jgi:hypothetical protein
MKLPQDYTKLTPKQRKLVREEYARQQNDMCMYCHASLDYDPPEWILQKQVNWDLFPPHFLKHHVHLQHNHATGMTEGAVHAYCNAVMWQYEGR